MSSGPNTTLAARTRDLAAGAEQPRPGALTASPDDRYGSLFLQPVYTPAPGPQRRVDAASTWAPGPSGRRARR